MDERKRQKLPIEDYEEDIVGAIKNNDFLVIIGETGSGKTTQLPQFLHRAGLTSNGGKIGITQPRRIAAISVATRVCEEMDCVLGGELFDSVSFFCPAFVLSLATVYEVSVLERLHARYRSCIMTMLIYSTYRFWYLWT